MRAAPRRVSRIARDNPEWHPLFTEAELAKALKRLKDYRYKA
jgi:hypothetical protein